MTDWTPPPPVTYAADMALFAGFMEGDDIDPALLLIKRGNDPYKGRWALPGGHVEADKEGSYAAAIRETEEETGIAVDPQGGDMVLCGVYDQPGRDPRGLVVSAGYTTAIPVPVEPKAGDDAKDAQWVPLRGLDLRMFAFDHANIVRDALAAHGYELADFQ